MKRSEIEKYATQILRDHNLLEVPVDPLKVARALGIKVMNAVFSEPEKSGAVAKHGETFQIFLNANEPPARKRFTIAHEIGHRLLHMGPAGESEFVDTEENFRTIEASDSEDRTLYRRQEWEANAFAAALLINEESLRDAWQDCRDPTILAWKFQVSPAAMIVRLSQLGLLEALP
jgi:Zn-dependent peptidase ImmA (M78 family)